MAKTDYGPEVGQALNEQKNPVRPRSPGQQVAREERFRTSPNPPPGVGGGVPRALNPMQNVNTPVHPAVAAAAPHLAAAAGIAHAILANRGLK